MNKELFKQGIILVSFLAVLWLTSALEIGAAGTWAVWTIACIILAMCGLGAYDTWARADRQSRDTRKTAKMTHRMIEQSRKEMYLREITY